MKKRNKRKIEVEVVESVNKYGYIMDEELREESAKYEPENYNPLENIENKEIVIPNTNKTETITMRFTKDEYDSISEKALKQKISKSAYIRMVLFSKQENIDTNVILTKIEELRNDIKKVGSR